MKRDVENTLMDVEFGTLSPSGYVHTRSIKRSDILGCPKVILLPSHYREDGSCRCDVITCEWEFPCEHLKYKEEIYCIHHLREMGEYEEED